MVFGVAAEVSGFLSLQECIDLRQRIDTLMPDSEVQEYEDPEVRSQMGWDRLRVRDDELSAKVKARLKTSVSAMSLLRGWPTDFDVGLWFFTRYPTGGGLGPHSDGRIGTDDYFSIASILIYLNEDFKGGQTVFLDDDGKTETWRCVPQTGKLLILKQDVTHKSEPVAAGCKYLLRSDIMTRRVPLS